MYRIPMILAGLCAMNAHAVADPDPDPDPDPDSEADAPLASGSAPASGVEATGDTEHIPRHAYVALGAAFVIQHEYLGPAVVLRAAARVPGIPIYLGASGVAGTIGDSHGAGPVRIGALFAEARQCPRAWACLYAELAVGWTTHTWRSDSDGHEELRHGPLVAAGLGAELRVGGPVHARLGFDLSRTWSISDTPVDSSARRRYGGSVSAALELGF